MADRLVALAFAWFWALRGDASQTALPSDSQAINQTSDPRCFCIDMIVSASSCFLWQGIHVPDRFGPLQSARAGALLLLSRSGLDSLKRDVIYLPKNSLCRCFKWCIAPSGNSSLGCIQHEVPHFRLQIVISSFSIQRRRLLAFITGSAVHRLATGGYELTDKDPSNGFCCAIIE